jgi:hypothetical protein
MAHVDCTDFVTQIDAPVQLAFSTMTNVAAWHDWTSAITSSRGVTPGDVREGYEFVMKTMVAPVSLRLTVVEFEQNRRVAWARTFPGAKVLHRIEFQPNGLVQCVVHNHEFVEGSLARPVGGLLAKPINRLDRQWARDLAARLQHS